MPFLGVAFEWIAGAIGTLISSQVLKAMLTRALVLLGISTITYTGVSVAVSAAFAKMTDGWSGLPIYAVQLLTLAHIPQAINVICSALLGSLAVRGLTTAGALKRVVWRPGQTGDLFGA